MDNLIYELQVGGQTVRYLLRDPMTARHFAVPLEYCGGELYDVTADDALMREGRKLFPPNYGEANLEHKLLILPTAKFLLQYSICIIHAVAFAWRGMAWLLCGPSGTGKTTQFRRWVQLCGQDVSLICGDMPLVSLEKDGSILVSPSPWPGKERLPGIAQAPLGGVVFLEQSGDNSISPLAPEQSVQRLISSCMTKPGTLEEIAKFTAVLDHILSGHPAWLLRNRGDLDSARLTKDRFEAYLTKG